ncbi:MAG: sulfur oxidation c-type cytochrome SoxX [Gammaproteobacteria bacterium]|nr:sulfur oxidation c-type cytochrome SoxX [Gammaproteobacteria bacterium]
MRNTAQLITAASAVATLLGALSVSLPVAAAEPSVLEQGKAISFDNRKGNCLACHQIEGGDLPGNIGPPLVVMKARFPDKAKLRAQIFDSTQANPNSIMPPFGRHQILTSDELDKVVEFIYSL